MGSRGNRFPRVSDIEMVVNLHVTERCNYRCTYCFGKWGLLQESSAEASVWADKADAYRIMWELANMFRRNRGTDSPIRFNFVGGEPALLPTIEDLIGFAREELSTRVSYVTNGLMLRTLDAEQTAQKIDIIGISIDSSRQSTNLQIGRATRSGKVLDLIDIGNRVQAIREAADRLDVERPEIKVNTVVSALNVDEDFGPVLEAINPDRWKVLKMLPVYSVKTAISDDAFRGFADRHREYVSEHLASNGLIITTEDNDEMTGSYAMIDPLARFFWYDEVPESGYTYSDPMTAVSVEKAWAAAGAHWDEQKFGSRYTKLIGSVDTAEPEVDAPTPSPQDVTPQSVAEPAASRKPVPA